MKMKTTFFVVSMLAVLIGGCGNSVSCRGKSYGPEYMTYSGDHNVFNGACQSVMEELAYKIINEDKSYRMPHSSEGCSSHKVGEDVVGRIQLFRRSDVRIGPDATTGRLAGPGERVVHETDVPGKDRRDRVPDLCWIATAGESPSI